MKHLNVVLFALVAVVISACGKNDGGNSNPTTTTNPYGIASTQCASYGANYVMTQGGCGVVNAPQCAAQPGTALTQQGCLPIQTTGGYNGYPGQQPGGYPGGYPGGGYNGYPGGGAQCAGVQSGYGICYSYSYRQQYYAVQGACPCPW